MNAPTPGAFSKPDGKIGILAGMVNGRRWSGAEIAAAPARGMSHVLTSRPLRRIPVVQRNQEIAADSIGLALMAPAGFNPQAATDVLSGSITGRAFAAPMDSHPAKLARAQLLRQLLPQAMAFYRHAVAPVGLAPA